MVDWKIGWRNILTANMPVQFMHLRETNVSLWSSSGWFQLCHGSQGVRQLQCTNTAMYSSTSLLLMDSFPRLSTPLRLARLFFVFTH